MAQQINLTSLVKQFTELQRPVERPKFLSGIVHPDYVIINWKEAERKTWGSLPYKVPQVLNTRIEYKKMVDSIWTQVKTNSDTTTSVCLYKKNPIHQFSQPHQVWEYFWNEYNAFEEDVYYDVRFCYENNHEHVNWTTMSSVGIPSLPPSFQFCGFLKEDLDNPIINQCYLVVEHDNPKWKSFKNCLAMYSTNGRLEGWIIYYPRKGWMIDNFYYNGNEWVDIKLKNTMTNLYKTFSSKDILFKVLNMGFSSRFFHPNILETYFDRFIN